MKRVLTLFVCLICLISSCGTQLVLETPTEGVMVPETAEVKPEPNETTPAVETTEPEKVVQSVEPIMYEPYGSAPLVRDIAQAMFNHELEFDISSYDVPIEVIMYSANEAMAQNPMIIAQPSFYVPNESSTLLLDYNISFEETIAKREEVWERVRTLIAPSNYPAMSDYEKTEYIFNLVVDIVEYDYDSNEAIQTGDYSKYSQHTQDAYGSLVEGKAVCVGYTDAYAILARAIGLEAVVVEGDVLALNWPHAWNRVNLSGDWVTTDATWGDANQPDYYYLNRSWEVFESDRTENIFANKADLTGWPSLSDDYTYFNQHNLRFTYEEGQDYILQAVENNQAQITFELTDGSSLEILNWVAEQDFYNKYPEFKAEKEIVRIIRIE